jgi:hypothetical protein
MRRALTFMFFLTSIAVILPACGDGATPTPAATEETTTQQATQNRLDPNDPTILRRPFTAEQIREELVEGLSIDIRRSTPDGETVERWTVLKADEEGLEMESTALDADGNPTGESNVSRSTWIELRDHATFSADRATFEETTLETPLGMLSGWLYSIRNEADGTVTEMFFAKSLPGAPVVLRETRGDEMIMEMTQLARARPE